MKKETIKKIFDKALEKQKSIILIGDYGIGKSQLVYDYSKQKANELGKELIIWHILNENEKKQFVENANLDNYFFLVDIKLQSVGDISKITGIPIIINNNHNHKIFWELPSFLKILSRDKVYGILFLDEINMASPSLQSTCFELLLQKKIGEWKLSDNILIVGAGNTLEVNISANPIPKPLLNRVLLLHFEGFDIEEWIKWAITKKLDSRVISFVKMFQILKKDSEEELKQSTRPRSFEILSDMIQNEEDLDYITTIAFSVLEESTASQFIAFVKLLSKLNYKEYLENPNKFVSETNENKYAIITLIEKNIKSIKIEELINFITQISKTDAEFSLLLLMLLKKHEKLLDKVFEKLDKALIDRFIKILTF